MIANRTIRSHKGGRRASIHVRLTPQARERLDDVAGALGVSVADIIERQANIAGSGRGWRIAFDRGSANSLREMRDELVAAGAHTRLSMFGGTMPATE